MEARSDPRATIASVAAFDGVDLDGVTGELSRFVVETTPKNISSGNFITTASLPQCGRARALELTERVRPILDGLYPNWRAENADDSDFEFAAQRDACERLLSRIASHTEINSMLAGLDASPRLSANQLHDLVWRAASAQWSTGHLHEAVLAASKAVNSMLQSKLGRRDVSDVKLVREAFAEGDPVTGRPRLRFLSIDDDQTRESMRQGVMAFGAGCFQAIRNPVGHLPNEENELAEQEALERLSALSLLARWIDEADVCVAE